MNDSRIIVALDVDSVEKARPLVDELHPYVRGFKVGYDLHYNTLADLLMMDLSSAQKGHEEALALIKKIEEIQAFYRELAPQLFLDLKIHDTPDTMVNAMKAIVRLQPWVTNFHGSAGNEAMEKLLAVRGDSRAIVMTVPTSLKPGEAKLIYGADPITKALYFAQRGVNLGADGVICSAQEVGTLSEDSQFDSLDKFTPGIRLPGDDPNDQNRIGTPKATAQAGSTYQVLGRAITGKDIPNRVDRAKLINDMIADGLARRGR